MPVVEVTEFRALVEQHSVALPVEAVCQEDPPLGAGCHGGPRSVDLFNGLHPIADTQVDLVQVRGGQAVWFPDRHVHILPDVTSRMHAPRDLRAPSGVPAGRR